METNKEEVEIPLGLLLEKWMVYYYPILDSDVLIPQINGVNSKLAFQTKFLKIINYYNKVGGLSGFYNDIGIKGISNEINKEFYELIKELKTNIVKNPMQFIGNSINKSYYKLGVFVKIKSILICQIFLICQTIALSYQTAESTVQ